MTKVALLSVQMHAQQATGRYSGFRQTVGLLAVSGTKQRHWCWPIDFREERSGTRQMSGDMVKGRWKGRVVGKWRVELEGGNEMGMCHCSD